MCTEIIDHPSEFISIRDNTLKTTSLKVGEAFSKNHRDVLRKLEGLDCSKEFNERNFALVEYQDAKGESRPMWEMTKDGFMFLVMGFTGKKAARVKEAYILAFNWMAEQLANAKAPALPATIEPRTLHDLDYVQDLRHDDSQTTNVRWWVFERKGGPSNWAGSGACGQGEHFFNQTHQLALNNPGDAERAITWSLMHLIGGSVERVGIKTSELEFCQQIARAAVAWMIAAGKGATPPSHQKRRGRKTATRTIQ